VSLGKNRAYSSIKKKQGGASSVVKKQISTSALEGGTG